VLGIPLTSPAFALNAIIYAVSLVILWYGMHEIRDTTRSKPAASSHGTWSYYWKVISSPRVASFAPAWIAVNAVLGVFINLTARVLTDKGTHPGQLLMGAFDSFQAGNIRALYAIVFVLGILLWSLIFAQLNKTTVMLIGTGGLFMTCALLYGINHQPSLHAPLVLPLALLLFVSIVIQSGFTPAALAHLADITEEFSSDRGAIMGLYSVFLGVGQVIGASLGGPFVDRAGADGVVAVSVLLGLVSAGTLFLLRRVEGRTASPAASA
jgi:predicted MFS family arabinose efflux permease